MLNIAACIAFPAISSQDATRVTPSTPSEAHISTYFIASILTVYDNSLTRLNPCSVLVCTCKTPIYFLLAFKYFINQKSVILFFGTCIWESYNSLWFSLQRSRVTYNTDDQGDMVSSGTHGLPWKFKQRRCQKPYKISLVEEKNCGGEIEELHKIPSMEARTTNGLC